ncbi:hypothetical protein [Rufibacter radiotolerans]|uniref:hypothetical protein n=1 Tax=Rufibacter radiotolerans TaxID=1379910 RepID=UPI0006647080|nr:hypothetical protein [Rufibacter radiotolerans]
MKKHILLLSFLLVWFYGAQAQETPSVATSGKKYLGMIELGYLYQNNQNNTANSADASPTFNIFTGYQFHRMLSVGATVGLDFYNSLLVTPVALGLRGTLLSSRVSPIYSLDAGYGSAFLSDEPDQADYTGGWMVNPALGLRANTGTETAFTFTLGYKVQRATTENTQWNNNVITNKFSFKRLSVRMGFLF